MCLWGFPFICSFLCWSWCNQTVKIYFMYVFVILVINCWVGGVGTLETLLGNFNKDNISRKLQLSSKGIIYTFINLLHLYLEH